VTTIDNDADCVSGGGGPPPSFHVWPLKNMTAQLYNLTVDPYERDDVAARRWFRIAAERGHGPAQQALAQRLGAAGGSDADLREAAGNVWINVRYEPFLLLEIRSQTTELRMGNEHRHAQGSCKGGQQNWE
jgi:TPR repeat protein